MACRWSACGHFDRFARRGLSPPLLTCIDVPRFGDSGRLGRRSPKVATRLRLPLGRAEPDYAAARPQPVRPLSVSIAQAPQYVIVQMSPGAGGGILDRTSLLWGG